MAERTIHLLSEQVASQIAAGEVVERPASAVKELIENSIDAGARSISVEIKRGGADLIAVSDDGCGMGREDAILSVRRHATSKIRDAADLESILTLGFRGEALASIASVSELGLTTRRATDEAGVSLSTVGGEIVDERTAALAPGTRIEVRRLFFNTPARLKFLKTVATEQGAVAAAVQRLGLANPKVAFRWEADGRTIMELPRAHGLLERIRQIFGGKLAGEMLEFMLEREGGAASGFVSNTQISLATNRMVFTFVNGRAVRDRLLIRAVAQAYATMIPRGRWPAAVLLVKVRPAEVDVNIHPMKIEVRFRNSGAVFELVYRALRDRLADQTSASSLHREATADEAAQATPDGSDVVAGFPAQPKERPESRLRLTMDSASALSIEQKPLGLGYGTGPNANAAPMENRAPNPRARIPIYSQLKVVGQVFAGYIALEGDDGLILVDQHAAHERVTFEKLRDELRAGEIRVQSRLVPETVELNPARAGRVQWALPQLRALGFDVEAFGGSALVLKGAPAVFGPEAGPTLLIEMIEGLADGETQMRGEEAFEGLLKQLACHGSIRVGRRLEEREIRELLAELDRTEFKSNCPHGRPVHIEFGRGSIERMFRR
jgi:DNA mismatch repair protein MutL